MRDKRQGKHRRFSSGWNNARVSFKELLSFSCVSVLDGKRVEMHMEFPTKNRANQQLPTTSNMNNMIHNMITKHMSHKLSEIPIFAIRFSWDLFPTL